MIKNFYKNLIKILDDKIELKYVNFLKYFDFFFMLLWNKIFNQKNKF